MPEKSVDERVAEIVEQIDRQTEIRRKMTPGIFPVTSKERDKLRRDAHWIRRLFRPR